MTHEPLELRRIYGPRTPPPPGLWRTHDLSGIGLSAQTADNAQHDESHRALGYEGQGLA
jgi:hypothetical protein